MGGAGRDTYPSSVSLIMSQISMFNVQSSLCREPSVAFSVKSERKQIYISPGNRGPWQETEGARSTTFSAQARGLSRQSGQRCCCQKGANRERPGSEFCTMESSGDWLHDNVNVWNA